MPRQTNEKNMLFPDGFRLEISTDGTVGSVWEDVGVLAGGATVTFNWDEFYLDGGNYEGLVDKAINPTIALAPSAVWNFDATVIKNLFPGMFAIDSATSPTTGNDVTYAGASNQVTLKRSKIRLTHYTVDASGGSEADTDIDWQFTLHNAKIDAGGSFNFKGVNEDGLDEVTVSFTGKCDPADSHKLFTFFQVQAQA
jgi:hypothetical protein